MRGAWAVKAAAASGGLDEATPARPASEAVVEGANDEGALPSGSSSIVKGRRKERATGVVETKSRRRRAGGPATLWQLAFIPFARLSSRFSCSLRQPLTAVEHPLRPAAPGELRIARLGPRPAEQQKTTLAANLGSKRSSNVSGPRGHMGCAIISERCKATLEEASRLLGSQLSRLGECFALAIKTAPRRVARAAQATIEQGITVYSLSCRGELIARPSHAKGHG